MYRVQSTTLTTEGLHLILLPDATVTVSDKDGELASLFQDSEGLIPADNPFVSGGTGAYDFYVAFDDYYDLVIDGPTSSVDERIYPVTKAYLDAAINETTRTLDNRAAAVSWVAANPETTQRIIKLPNMAFRRSIGATAIADMPGWLPDGDVQLNHFLPVTGVAIEAAVKAAADYVGSLGGGEITFRRGVYEFDADNIGTSEGTSVLLVAGNSNVKFRGEAGAILKPASNRIEMFSIDGADNVEFTGFTWDNSDNGPLQYQAKPVTKVKNGGIAGLGNPANCAIRQYEGSGLTVRNCVFEQFTTSADYVGSFADDQVLSGRVIMDNITFIDYGFGLLTAQPEHVMMTNVHSVRCFQSINGNNTDGTETDLTVVSNDPGHAIYVTNRGGAFPKTVTIADFSDTDSQSTSIRVRKGEVVSITNSTHNNCERLVNAENISALTLSNISGKMGVSTFSNQSGLEIIDCANWSASNVSIDISGVNAWAVQINPSNGNRNTNGTLSGLRVVNDAVGTTGKAPVIITGQTNLRIESPAYTHTGTIVSGRAFIDVNDCTNVQVITPTKHTPDGVADTKLVSFDVDCVDCVVKWSEADLDQAPDANTIVDNGTGTRVFRDGILSGTSTPTVRFATNGDFVPTYNTQEGVWIKQGGYVTENILLQFTANAYTTAAGDIQIPLTFTVKDIGLNNWSGTLAKFTQIDVGSTAVNLMPIAAAGDDFLYLRQSVDNGNGTNMGTGNVPASTAGVIVALSITYPFEE